MSAPATLEPVRETFRALARAVVPAAERLDETGWRGLESVVEDALRDRSAELRAQVVLFLRGVGTLARVRLGRSLAAAEPERVRTFLSGLERAPLVRMRVGFWGVRTLALMGYYGRPEATTEVAYRATAAGWSARGGGAGPWEARAGRGAPEPGIVTAPRTRPDDA